MPTDHLIDNDDEFLKCLERVVSKKLITHLSTLGLKPSRPETRYGYIEIEKTVDDSIGISKGFVEKPDEVTVKEMLSKGNFFWNTGIFICKQSLIKKYFNDFAPYLLESVSSAVEKKVRDLNFWKLDETHWSNCQSISVDYAIMEKISYLNVVEFVKDGMTWATGEPYGKKVKKMKKLFY